MKLFVTKMPSLELEYHQWKLCKALQDYLEKGAKNIRAKHDSKYAFELWMLERRMHPSSLDGVALSETIFPLFSVIKIPEIDTKLAEKLVTINCANSVEEGLTTILPYIYTTIKTYSDMRADTCDEPKIRDNILTLEEFSCRANRRILDLVKSRNIMDVTMSLLRYASSGARAYRRGIAKETFDKHIGGTPSDKYIGSTPFEAFATPFTAIGDKFCTLHPDVDKCFGGATNFFKTKLSSRKLWFVHAPEILQARCVAHLRKKLPSVKREITVILLTTGQWFVDDEEFVTVAESTLIKREEFKYFDPFTEMHCQSAGDIVKAVIVGKPTLEP